MLGVANKELVAILRGVLPEPTVSETNQERHTRYPHYGQSHYVVVLAGMGRKRNAPPSVHAIWEGAQTTRVPSSNGGVRHGSIGERTIISLPPPDGRSISLPRPEEILAISLGEEIPPATIGGIAIRPFASLEYAPLHVPDTQVAPGIGDHTI